MPLTYLLAAFFAFSAMLNLVATVTRRCRQEAHDFERQVSVAAAEPMPAIEPAPVAEPGSDHVEKIEESNNGPAVTLREIPAAEQGSHYLRELLTPRGILGMLSSPVALIFLVLNAMILGETFELILDRAGAPLGRLSIAGQPIELTDFHVLGLLCSVALLLIAGFWAESNRTKSPSRWFLLIAGLLMLYAFEVGVSGYRGWHQAIVAGYEDPLVHATFAGSIAHIAFVVELMTGIWLIHGVAVPALLAVFWYLVAPFRSLARKVTRYWLTRQAAVPPRPQAATPLTRPAKKLRPPIGIRIGARIDEGLFDPLRAVDRWTARLLRLPARWVASPTAEKRGVHHA